ncbi:hypothetical protein BH11PLA2_BH11PLA2_14970 [soil metagenome]
MPMANDTPRTVTSVLLGVVVLCQFAAVLVTNIAGYIAPTPDSTSGVAAPVPSGPASLLRFAADRYTEATGQPQGWGMFESGYMRNGVTWDVRIALPDNVVHRVQGVAVTPDELSFYNFPSGHNRRFIFESGLLGFDLVLPHPIDGEDFPAEQLEAFIEDVRVNNAAYHSFLRNLYARERFRHPDWPVLPESMEFCILRFPVREPGSDTVHPPEVRYVARWKPSEATPATLPIEAYDRGAEGAYRRFHKSHSP